MVITPSLYGPHIPPVLLLPKPQAIWQQNLDRKELKRRLRSLWELNVPVQPLCCTLCVGHGEL